MQRIIKTLVLEQFQWVRTLYKLNDHHLMLHNSDGNCSAIHDGQDDAVKCVKFDTMANNTAKAKQESRKIRKEREMTFRW